MIFEKIKTHYDNHRADGHPSVGAIFSFFLAGVLGLFFGFTGYLIGLICGGLIIGIVIEIAQRINRHFSNSKQNTIKESLLDAAVTACWPFFIFRDLNR